jgi:RNA polymerase sigma factor (TIGR02999 family)
MKGCARSHRGITLDTTQLLSAARAGDKSAEARLFDFVYADLHRLAQRHLRASGPDAQHATSLVHEVYLRLARGGQIALNDRNHFFAVASRAMRQIVIDHVRGRLTEKRGGGVEPLSLDSAIVAVAAGHDEQLLMLDAALQRLGDIDPRLAQFVELRFYGGLQMDELAEATGLSERTLKRDWQKARAFLYRELTHVG